MESKRPAIPRALAWVVASLLTFAGVGTYTVRSAAEAADHRWEQAIAGMLAEAAVNLVPEFALCAEGAREQDERGVVLRGFLGRVVGREAELSTHKPHLAADGTPTGPAHDTYPSLNIYVVQRRGLLTSHIQASVRVGKNPRRRNLLARVREVVADAGIPLVVKP